MARLPRFVLPGQPQHVIQRGNNREVIFAADADYRFYLDKLGGACEKHACDVHAYVLMTNHVHLLMTPGNENGISKVMQSVGRHYVQYFNTTYGRTGTLWEGRYRATLLDTESYLLTCYRYIELNPVRAGLVDHPKAYPWSSYRFNASGEVNQLVTPHELYKRLGRTAPLRQSAYRTLFRAKLGKRVLADIREATNKAWALGDDRFKAKVEALLDRRAAPTARGGDRKSEKFRKTAPFKRV